MWGSEHSASLAVSLLPPVRRKALASARETCCLACLLSGRQAVLVPEKLSSMPRLLHALLNEFSLLPVKLCLGRLPAWALSTGCAYNKISGEAKWLIHNRFFFF